MHALSRWLGHSYIRVSTHASLGANLHGPLLRPDHWVDLLHRCRCPKFGPVHKPPRLELELVPVKRLTTRPWRPTCLVGDETCTVHRGDVSPYSLTSVHVARSTVGKRCHLRFPLYVNLSILRPLHCFIPSLHFSLNISVSNVLLSSPKQLASSW